MKNIFDLTKTDDLPESVQESAGLNKESKPLKRLLEIFSLKERLTLSEFIVGFYRLYGIELKRGSARTRLFYFTKKGILRRDNKCRGVFVLNKKKGWLE